MAEQPDLFIPGVAEAPWPSLDPSVGASGIDRVAALDEEGALAQLLARCGASEADPIDLACALLDRFGGIGRVIGAPAADLARVVGAELAVELGVVHALLLRVLDFPLRHRAFLGSWGAAKTYLRARLRALPREAFHVLFLDRRNQLIADERMGEGSISHAPVYPREVVRRALELSACGVLLAHNHPSGDPTPSPADIEMTRQVVDACRALDIAVHDHLIVGGEEVASLKALGLM
ncbi:MAG: DNA repair protein RadC [Alphaproteobacteria bacterium]|nr:DNA repair protein RadC [Alphaproteobacteria bacterium]MBU1516530.1 DNA repair protein RadC [Alphaproteobacteria bacterium]MBU2094287.1 DNA repair protein RadC [Alphaproteobacteria bacterium]MBU2154136.1 DNA repair protein RadC [Alphaproteobacteria bacterium]MBU2307457.1 DNA repair protein RadC [Alphaproteobacteria bacterium]